MKNLKKLIAVMAALTSMMALAACGNSDVNSNVSSQNNSDATVTESATAMEGNGEEQETVQTGTDVSMESLLNHAETPAEDFTYYISEDRATIDGYVGTDPIVVIPESIEGYPVKAVRDISGKGIQAIKFPDSMEVIGDSLFMGDEDIQYVVFGANIKEVGEYTFLYCSNMKEIQLNDTLEKIGWSAFTCYSDYVREIHIPESVTKIDGAAFEMDDTQTIYVKAGSYAETYCVESKENYPDLTYIVE